MAFPTIDGGIPVRAVTEAAGKAARAPREDTGARFGEALKQAISEVDDLQQRGEAAQQAFARGEPIELHDVLIRVEEAEIAFKTMMEVRNKLVTAYQDILRMGG